MLQKLIVLGLVTGALATAAVAQEAAALAESDRKFLSAAISAGLTEVELGGIVSGKAQDAEVKKFADSMVSDHSKVNDKLTALLDRKQIKIDKEIEAESKDTIEKFRTMEAAELEREYKSLMVQNHQKSIDTFEQASTTLVDADLKQFATETLPALKHHHQMAQALVEGKQIGSVPAPADADATVADRPLPADADATATDRPLPADTIQPQGAPLPPEPAGSSTTHEGHK